MLPVRGFQGTTERPPGRNALVKGYQLQQAVSKCARQEGPHCAEERRGPSSRAGHLRRRDLSGPRPQRRWKSEAPDLRGCAPRVPWSGRELSACPKRRVLGGGVCHTGRGGGAALSPRTAMRRGPREQSGVQLATRGNHSHAKNRRCGGSAGSRRPIDARGGPIHNLTTAQRRNFCDNGAVTETPSGIQ